jgi:hypothetical protein
VADREGRFAFTKVGSGLHQLVASAPGLAMSRTDIDVDRDLVEVEIRIPRP